MSNILVNTIKDTGNNTLLSSDGSGSVTLGSGFPQNTPAFEAQLTSTQSITDLTYTKVEIDNEIFDTNNCYDNSTNYRFTPTVSGKYFVYASVAGDPLAVNELEELRVNIYKNGSSIRSTVINFSNNDARLATLSIQATVDMNGTTDYLEIYGRVNDISGSPQFYGLNNETYFGAYRIIGA